MDLHEFDNVKAEKAIAMRSYRRRRNLKWLSEACAALFVLTRSSSWLPIAMEFCAAFSRQLIAVFKNHLFVFALFNLIIFLVYALSGKIPTDNKKHRSVSGSGSDLYDEFVSNSVSSRRISTGGDSTASAPEVLFHDKQIICSENVASPPAQNNNGQVTKPKGSPPISPPGHAVCTDKEKALVVKCYRRTQSENFNGEKVQKHSQREFRRSVTEIEPGRRSSSVDQMNDDEFNRAIEAFIATQKSIQREEYKQEGKT